MRIFPLVLVSALICSCSGYSSTVNLDNEKKVRAALVGSWESTHLETSTIRIEVPKGAINIVSYSADGSFEIKMKGGIMSSTGNWSYDPTNHKINESREAQNHSVRIVRLTERELDLAGYT